MVESLITANVFPRSRRDAIWHGELGNVGQVSKQKKVVIDGKGCSGS